MHQNNSGGVSHLPARSIIGMIKMDDMNMTTPTMTELRLADMALPTAWNMVSV